MTHHFITATLAVALLAGCRSSRHVETLSADTSSVIASQISRAALLRSDSLLLDITLTIDSVAWTLPDTSTSKPTAGIRYAAYGIHTRSSLRNDSHTAVVECIATDSAATSVSRIHTRSSTLSTPLPSLWSIIATILLMSAAVWLIRRR